MQKKFFSLFLAIIMIVFLISAVHSASDEAVSAAESLYKLGLFNGTGKDANGNPIFDLDLAPNRHQAVVMLVRLLGKSVEAEKGSWSTPFTDVADWAAPYVGYAYTNNLTTGTSATTYSGNDIITASQYITFVLRALGYESGTDFQWDKAWELSDEIGLTDGQYTNNSTSFTRGDVVIISFNALSCTLKGTDISLAEKLLENGTIDFFWIDRLGLTDKVGRQTIAPPTNVRIDKQNGQSFLVWTAPQEEVTSYDVSVATDKTGVYDLFFTPSKDYILLESTVVYELKPATTYFFKVRAVKWSENEEKHYFSAFTQPIAYTTPASNVSTSSNLSNNIQITQLVLSDKALNITPGETIAVSTTCIPMYACPVITWTSSDPSVATVQSTGTEKKENVYNGTTYDDAYFFKANITAVSAGNTVITVKTDTGITATINVTVSGDNIAKAQAAVDALKSILKFPASLSLNSVRIYQGNSTGVVEIDYSAMNGFGGYNRGYFYYSGTTSSTGDYSIIDKYGYSYVTIDISKLK